MDNENLTEEDVIAADRAGVADLEKALTGVKELMQQLGVPIMGILVGKPVVVIPGAERVVTLFEYTGNPTFINMLMLKSLAAHAQEIHGTTGQMIEHIKTMEAALGMVDQKPAAKPGKVFPAPGSKDIVH